MARLSTQTRNIPSELQDLRDRVDELERHNQALLAVNQVDITSRSHTSTLEPVIEEDNEDESTLHERAEACKEIQEKKHIECPSLFQSPFRNIKGEGNATLKKAGALVRKIFDMDFERLGPKRLVREYKLNRLRKQWRAEIGDTFSVDRRPTRISSEEEAEASEGEEAELEELRQLSDSLLAATAESPDGPRIDQDFDEEEIKNLQEWFDESEDSSSVDSAGYRHSSRRTGLPLAVPETPITLGPPSNTKPNLKDV